MGIIALEGLHFRANHGLHKEERENGNSFEVDIHLETNFNEAAVNDDISSTIDYEEVYRLVRDNLEGSHYLLEHLAHKIKNAIREKYDSLERVTVKVSKLNPPVGGPCQRASVTLTD